MSEQSVNSFGWSRVHLREELVAEDTCPECLGELDTGLECNQCGFDAQPESEMCD